MPILRITANATHPAPDSGPGIADALRGCDGPVTIMVHGYQYRPGHARRCPHRTIFAEVHEQREARVVSWPRHLRLRSTELGVSFGWDARGTLWAAHQRALGAGAALARLVAAIRAQGNGRPVHVIAHSLGARVALHALHDAAPGDVDRLILLAAAEYEAAAEDALTTRAGRACTVLNVTSRENDLFDGLFEAAIPAPRPRDRVLGTGRLRAPNLTQMQIDCPQTRAALGTLGYPIAAPRWPVCHRSAYLRPGLFPLYRAWFAGQVAAERLQAALPPQPSPRWSRLRVRSLGTPHGPAPA